MTDPSIALGPLPRGPHNLTRTAVESSQRLRLAVAMADAIAERGYANTPVAAVLERAGVSRQTFYALYDNKLDCFLDTLDFVGEVLVGQLRATLSSTTPPTADDSPTNRIARAIDRYLDTIATNPEFARLYVIEVHAAGPRALIRRAELQGRIVDGLAAVTGARSAAQRFACEMFVAAVSALVTLPIATGDVEALRALRSPLIDQLDLLRRSW